MPKKNKVVSGSLLSFDFGMKHIGVAVGDTFSQTAQPLTRLKATDGIPKWDKIAALINEWSIIAMVVGIPVNLDGSAQNITAAAAKFGRRLHNKFKLPVFEADERLTTKEAKSISAELNKKAKEFDSLAAALILESWLREHGD
jgi:putative holliday junction resolvase